MKRIQHRYARFLSFCSSICKNTRTLWSVIFIVLALVALIIVLVSFFRPRSLWSYVPLETQQVVYVELNDTMRDVLLRTGSAVPADIRGLFASIDTLLLGQNTQKDDTFSFVLGTLRRDVSFSSSTLEHLLTGDYTYALLRGDVFVYGTKDAVALVQNTENTKFFDTIVAPYAHSMRQQRSNIGVFTKVTPDSFLQAPALVEGVDAMVLLASRYADDIHGSFHVAGTTMGHTGNVDPFVPYFVDYMTDDTIVALEVGQFLFSSFQTTQLQQTLQAMLPVYDPSFASLPAEAYPLLAQGLKSNMYLGIYPSVGAVPIGIRLMFAGKELGSVLEYMRPGIQNIVATFFPPENVTPYMSGGVLMSGFVIQVGAGSGAYPPLQIPVVFGHDDTTSFIDIGNPLIQRTTPETRIPPYDDYTFAVLRVQFDPLIDIVDQYTALMLMQMGTGVVSPTNQFAALRGKYLQGYVTKTEHSIVFYFDLE